MSTTQDEAFLPRDLLFKVIDEVNNPDCTADQVYEKMKLLLTQHPELNETPDCIVIRADRVSELFGHE